MSIRKCKREPRDLSTMYLNAVDVIDNFYGQIGTKDSGWRAYLPTHESVLNLSILIPMQYRIDMVRPNIDSNTNTIGVEKTDDKTVTYRCNSGSQYGTQSIHIVLHITVTNEQMLCICEFPSS